jgi:hypothetical protein
MAKPKKHYAKYWIVRGSQAMWRDDPAKAGSPFRQVLITSDEFTSTQGTFQVYALEGASGGIKDHKLAESDEEPALLFDKDFNGLKAAVEQFENLVADAEARGFLQITQMDILEFEDKLRQP